jgi:hypothetical protein
MDTFCVEGAKFSLSMTSTQTESSVRKRGWLFTIHAFLISSPHIQHEFYTLSF